MGREKRRSIRSFTLIELLVIIAIIGILILLLSPVLYKAQGAANKAACINNLRQLGVAMQMYADDHEGAWMDISYEEPSGFGIMDSGGQMWFWPTGSAMVISGVPYQIGAYWPDYTDDPSIYLCLSDKALARSGLSPVNLKKGPMVLVRMSYSLVYRQGTMSGWSDGCVLDKYPRCVLIFDRLLFHNNNFNGLYSDGSARSFKFNATGTEFEQSYALARYVVGNLNSGPDR